MESNQLVLIKPDGTPVVIGKGGIPLLIPIAVPFSTILPGFLSVTKDNGVLSGNTEQVVYPAFKEAYKQLKILKENGETNIVTKEEYTAEMILNGGICGRFALDVDTETFRLPCMPGTYWAAIMQGQNVGDFLIDQMRPITGSFENFMSNYIQIQGAFSPQANITAGYYGASTHSSPGGLNFNSALLGPHFSGSETRPQSIVMDYQMFMYGTIQDSGTVKLSQLIGFITGVESVLQSKLDRAQYELDVSMRVKAWGQVGGDYNTPLMLMFGENIASITRISQGKYRIYFTNPLSDADYVVSVNVSVAGIVNRIVSPTAKETDYFEVGSTDYAGTPTDVAFNFIVV